MQEASLIGSMQDQSQLRRTACDAVQRCLDHGRLRVAPVRRPFRNGQEGHFHPTPEVFIQVHGACEMRLLSDTFRSEPDDLLVIPRGVAHHEYPDLSAGAFLNLVYSYPNQALSVHAASGRNLPGSSSRIISRVVTPFAGASRLVAYLNDATSLVGDGKSADHPAVTGLIRAHFALWLEAFEAADVGLQPDQLVLHARQQVAVHLTNTRLSVAWLARRMRCSADYLSHRYRVVTGGTLVRYIQSERCELARGLLNDPSLTVAEVAFACGFHDPAYFSRVFSSRIGQSPSVYRRSLV